MRAAVMLLALLGPAARGAEVFPRGQELFPRLLADPRSIHIGGGYYRLDGRNVGDLAIGHSWGLARRKTGAWRWQTNIEGMAYSRFLLSGAINEFQTVDFFVNLPVEARRERFSLKAMLFHESSHLGDDYIRATGNSGFRFSIDGARAVAAYEPAAWARAYGGGTYLMHTIPSTKRGALQGGLELKSTAFELIDDSTSWVYLASDLQSWERAWWRTNWRTTLGLRFGLKDGPRAVRVFIGHFEGRSPYGQFFRSRERYNDVGVVLEL